MKKTDPLTAKKYITQNDVKKLPLIMHQRIGLQNEIAHWAGTDVESLNIAATYNVVHGSMFSPIRAETANAACSCMEETCSIQ